LAAARLLAAPASEGYRPKHALLAEAVVADMLPGERALLHERVARALETAGDEALAAEAAGHWASAGRNAEELQARLTAATAAEHVFAYADAAAHWHRAIELCEADPGADLGDRHDNAGRPVVALESTIISHGRPRPENLRMAREILPHLYIRAMDAFDDSGDRVRAGAIAEDAYRRFADLPDRAVAAVIHYRAAFFRAVHSPAEGLPLIREALRLFEGTPPSDEHARAWLDYAYEFLYQGEGRHAAEIRTALDRGLEVAEAAGAATQISQILCFLALASFLRGELEDGFRRLDQARSDPSDAWAALSLAIIESNALLKVGRLEEATRVGHGGFDAARRGGWGSTAEAAISLSNAVEGLLGRGRAAEAAALIDPEITGPVDWDHWPLLQLRADVDLVRGEVELAAQRLASVEIGGSEYALDHEQDVAEVALWAGRPDEALKAVHRAIERQAKTEWVILCGWPLALGMRACADLAERGRARRYDDTVRTALAAAEELGAWVDLTGGAPLTEHPFVAAIPAARATWDAERSRVAGASDPTAWSVAAEEWQALGYRHRAGYCWWRHAEAQLAAGQPPGVAAVAVRTAAAAADGHEPLLAEIRALARRARISLDTPPTTTPQATVPHISASYGLTERELAVLQLLTYGRSNAEIGAELFISPRTAGVHVTNILRKLGVTNRVQAAAFAERAGLLEVGQADGPLAHT
jgi:DNA-binding CsgD family transcriptional regulator/tetratricopeptide (TPR) repeat protein